MAPDDERRMIAAYRARTVPDADRQAELLERLLADEPLHVGERPWSRIGLAAGLAIAIAAAVLLFIRGAVALFTPVAPHETTEAVFDATPRESLTPTDAPPPKPAPARTSDARQHGDVSSPAADRAKSAAATPMADDALAQEAKLLARAQAAMRDGDPARAIAALAEHARRFPTGTMQLERDALRAIASCELDPQNAAHAHDVLADPRAASYASRIRHACKL